MPRYIINFSLIFIAVLSLTSCFPNFDRISYSQPQINGIAVKGLRAADVVVSVELDNPGAGFALDDISGMIHTESMDVAAYFIDPVSIVRKSEQTVELTVHVSLCPGVNLLSFLANIEQFTQGKYFADISAKVKLKNGFGKTIDYKNLVL